MRGTWVVPLCLIAVLVLSSAVSGYNHGSSGPDDPDSWHEHPYLGPGPIHIPAGHIEPVDGLAVLSVRDFTWWSIWSPQRSMGGYFCQVEPYYPRCEPSPFPQGPYDRNFCHGMTLKDGENWDSQLETYVWVGAQPIGVFVDGWGCEHYRPPTIGHVSHWPGHE